MVCRSVFSNHKHTACVYLSYLIDTVKCVFHPVSMDIVRHQIMGCCVYVPASARF